MVTGQFSGSGTYSKIPRFFGVSCPINAIMFEDLAPVNISVRNPALAGLLAALRLHHQYFGVMGVTTIGSPAAAEQDDDVTGDGRRVPAVERVLDHILAEMDAGRLRPGSRVNAARIAANLTLSVAPVREALSMLAGRGVLDLLPDRGAVMRPLTAKDVEQLWEIIAPVGGVGLDLAARAIAAGAIQATLRPRIEQSATSP